MDIENRLTELEATVTGLQVTLLALAVGIGLYITIKTIIGITKKNR